MQLVYQQQHGDAVERMLKRDTVARDWLRITDQPRLFDHEGLHCMSSVTCAIYGRTYVYRFMNIHLTSHHITSHHLTSPHSWMAA